MSLDNSFNRAIFLFCFLGNPICATKLQTQVLLPLSNQNGVPYYEDNFYGYFIEGFEVDKHGNFYFLSDTTTTLAVFSKEGKSLYRRHYQKFQPNRIYVREERMFLFDYKYEANKFFILDSKTGDIVKKFSPLLQNRVNSFIYLDSLLVLEVFDYRDRVDMHTPLAFLKYDLNGNFLGQVQNRYGLPDSIYTEDYEYSSVEYLGRWKDSYVFFIYDFNNRNYKFWLETESGQIVDTLSVKEELIGESFAENPSEHRKLRNGSIFILAKKNEYALVTEIKLDDVFTHPLSKKQE